MSWVTIDTVNRPVARTLRTVSFSEIEVNAITGGLVEATVKNECGARLGTPSAETVETHAIGLGTTSEVSSW